ncbi:allantoicase [Pseudogymnoascus verrucosus]|uniref:allantoicase n=1 Tax=Pseudogymnoascus verrucosus TaxID=342668 RepID=A0A1B8GQI6_9PEZI|nr:allantoicase [Pseudogymnoascus verrucosus]OBT98103.1 allantoicase [Pseudogymnoascus verrucosus]
MSGPRPYEVERVAATSVPAEKINETLKAGNIDLISSTLGGKILACSDEYFAPSTNLLNPQTPIHEAGKMVYTGAWFDGWETRRHNPSPFDWAIIRLGVASGTITGIEIDTAFFTGNNAPEISVEGVFSPSDEEVVSWAGGRGEWEPILGIEECGPSARFGWEIAESTGKAYTHVRLNMYPDGGIARFRLFGQAVPIFPMDAKEVFDLAAAQNGGVALSCSDEHFGVISNLLLPGRGMDMGDGWETRRTRGEHVDWAIVKLGARGTIERVVVDTAHFRGNFPQKVRVEGLNWERDGEPGNEEGGWVELVAESKTGPDALHEFVAMEQGKVFTHVKLVMIPDGGVKRLQIWGARAAS